MAGKFREVPLLVERPRGVVEAIENHGDKSVA